MTYDNVKMQESSKAFRASWDKEHFLTYSRERGEVMEHEHGAVTIWYWTSSEDFERAVSDLTATDWIYEEGEERC